MSMDYGMNTSQVFNEKLLESPEFLIENLYGQSLLTILYEMGNIDKELFLFSEEYFEKLLAHSSSFLEPLKGALSYMELLKTKIDRITYRNFCSERESWTSRLLSSSKDAAI